MRPPRAGDCGASLVELLAAAVERRDAKRLLDEIVIINRATNPSNEHWQTKLEELETRMHNGLTYIEPPPFDANAPKPRPRAPFLHSEKTKKKLEARGQKSDLRPLPSAL